ncbi:MAG: hypothetical protein JSS75_13425 [Bacteroidetes bacterium]|nr:hypothetical protein [Bacteroidota bacterium]
MTSYRNSTILLILLLASISASAQPMSPVPPPREPMYHGAPPIPPFAFNLSEMKFGAQGIGVQSCMYVQITNTAAVPQVIKKLYVVDGKDYSIPSPSQQMLPITVPQTSNVTISVCFKPTTPGDHNTNLTMVTDRDSIVLPIQGKGLKAEDLAKMPKVGLTIEEPKKHSKQWVFRLRLLAQSRVTMQVFDALGMLVQTYSMNDIKQEGVFEQTFEGLDKGRLPLPSGTYYVRCVVDEVARNNPQIYTKTITIK